MELEKRRAFFRKIFGVVGISANYLVDAEGIILALDLNGEKLEQKVAELLGE